jgi:hypothetical protein
MKLTRLKMLGVVMCAGFALAAVYGAVGPRGHAAALQGSVLVSTGAWNSSGDQSGMAIPASVNTATEFKSYIYDLLHNTTTSGIPGSDYNKYGAAFIVENMMHGQHDDGADSSLVSAAVSDYNAWANFVDDFSAAGRIQWSVSRTVGVGNLNTTHVCTTGSLGYCLDRSVYQNNDWNGGGRDAHSFQYFTMKSSEASTLIIFTNPDGTTFQLRRECGNVIAAAHALEDLGWNLSGRTTSTVSTVYAGEAVAFDSQLKNTGASAGNTTWTVAWCTDACSTWTNHASGTDSSVAKGGTWEQENNYPWTVSTSATYTKLCVHISYTNGAGPGTATETATAACVTVIPLQSTCGGVNVSPTLLGTADSYTVSANLNTNGGKPGAQAIADNSNFFIKVTGPSVNADNQNVTPVTVGGAAADTGSGSLAASVSPGATGDSGSYAITYGITGGTGAVTCSGSFMVAYRPYFSVLGGDVSAGAGFGASCTETSADLKSWNLNSTSTPNYYGAGSEIGAWATGNINNFVSGMGLSGGAAADSGSGLSFGNDTNTGGAGYGGNFGANAVPCLTDFYATRPTSPPSVSTGSLTSFAAVSSGSYDAPVDGSGTYTIGNGSDITVAQDAAGNGKQVTIYVAGNLYIKSNILYSYASLYQIPRINFYVKGDIYIDPNVTELHGVYMAQKISGTSGGHMTTCSPGVVSTPQSYATCNKQLTIVGAAAAENGMRLDRTYGNLAAAPGVTNQPAEVFQYSPELWLAQPIGPPFDYQAYTNLPPVL